MVVAKLHNVKLQSLTTQARLKNQRNTVSSVSQKRKRRMVTSRKESLGLGVMVHLSTEAPKHISFKDLPSGEVHPLYQARGQTLGHKREGHRQERELITRRGHRRQRGQQHREERGGNVWKP